MKYLLLVFLLISSNNFVYARGLIMKPLVVTVMPYCSTEVKCKLSITFKNLSNFKVEIYSHTFINNKPTYHGVLALLPEEYTKRRERKNHEKMPQQSNFNQKLNVNLTSFNRIIIEPLEEKGFILDNLDEVYKFKTGEHYILGYYVSSVYFYIDGEYTSSSYLGVPEYSLLSIPKKMLVPKIKRN